MPLVEKPSGWKWSPTEKLFSPTVIPHGSPTATPVVTSKRWK